jgi:citrate lyase subunit beta/citryl-CoA lyase
VEQVAVSEEIVRAFADNPQAGVLGIRGQMVDRAHIARAERILARAKAVGQG